MRNREQHVYFGPGSHLASNAEVAAMMLQDALRNRQTEAAPAAPDITTAEEPLTDVRQVVRMNPDTVVSDR